MSSSGRTTTQSMTWPHLWVDLLMSLIRLWRLRVVYIKKRTFASQSVWLVIVMDCQSLYSCHQQDKQILGGCLCNEEGQSAVQ